MTLSEIKTAVCQSFEIEESDFVIFGRSFPHSHARYAYFVLCRKYTLETMKTISNSVGMKDHQNVGQGEIRHVCLMKKNKEYAYAFNIAEKEVKQLKESKV